MLPSRFKEPAAYNLSPPISSYLDELFDSVPTRCIEDAEINEREILRN